METRLIKIEAKNIDPKIIREAGEIIQSGGLVAFPTETVYGLGGDALQRASSQKIYTAKGRPSDNPLIVHICEFDAVSRIVKRIPPQAKILADRFWPGPLTMIMEKSDIVPMETTGGLQTVAIRMPEDPIALAFIKASGGYIAAPSANTSGRPSPTLAEHVYEDMNGKIEMILDGGLVGIGLESTIVDLSEGVPTVLRPGYITREMLEEALGEPVEMDRTLLDADAKQAPKAPGMKYRHYAPKGQLTIVTGESRDVIDTINRLTAEQEAAGERVGVICTDESGKSYIASHIHSVGARMDEDSIARHLYMILRDFDKEKVSVIYSESFSDKGMGQAIMNRLLKAAGHHIMQAKR